MSPLPPLVAVAAATSPLSYGGKGDGVFGETVEGQRKAPLSIDCNLPLPTGRRRRPHRGACPPLRQRQHQMGLGCQQGRLGCSISKERGGKGGVSGETVEGQSPQKAVAPSLPFFSFSYSPAYPLQPSQASPSPPASFLHRSFFVVVLEQRWPTELM